ncbi:MAG: hypothetical protein WDZ46_09390 [Solirubrobacterales bacterium]
MPLLAAALFLVSADLAAACPNEASRIAQGSQHLPDCRAYELVTPGERIEQNTKPARASVNGDAVTYYSTLAGSEAETSSYFHLSRRQPTGWTAQSVGPQVEIGAIHEHTCEQNVFFSPNLGKHTYEHDWYDPEQPALCKRSDDLVPGEPHPQRNVLLFDTKGGAPQLINVASDSVDTESLDPANAKFQDASDDFSRIVFSTEARLTADAPTGRNFYIWEDGAVRLITILADGEPTTGELVEAAGHRGSSGIMPGSGLAPVTGALSADGSRVLFYAEDGLYLRERPTEAQSAIGGGECTEAQRACTVQVDASQGPGPDGGGVFWRASADGGTIFFTSDRKLTEDSTAEPGKPDLYRYVVGTGQLTDLTADPDGAADVRGVSDAATDGSSIYFVANGVLAPGATPGNCTGPVEAGQTCNLYVVGDGPVSFIASLLREDRDVWQGGNEPTERRKQSTVRASASANGKFLAFSSQRSLTGYDNRQITSDAPTRQIFLFQVDGEGGGGQLGCVSCIPDGTRPADSSLSLLLAGNYGPGPHSGNASWKVRHVLNDGRVLFDSLDPLLPEDVNGVRDVYQYGAGQLSLISTGEHGGETRFLAASPSGSDVFFRTGQALVPSDTDNEAFSLYDARVGGGFAEGAAPAPPCNEETCRGLEVLPPLLALPGSAELRASQAPTTNRAKRRRCNQLRRRQARRRCRQAKTRGKRARRCKRAGSGGKARHCRRGKRLQRIRHRRAVSPIGGGER